MTVHAHTTLDNHKFHLFSVQEAEKFGVTAAIVLYHIQFWLNQNAQAQRNIKDGYVWSYMTVEDIAKQLTYIPESTIYRILDQLVKAGVLIRSRYNRHAYDRTYWYTLPEFAVTQTTTVEISEKPAEPAPQANSHVENDNSQSERTIPNIKTSNQKTSKPTTTPIPQIIVHAVAPEKSESSCRDAEIVFHKAIPKDQRADIQKRIDKISDISLQQAILDVLTAAILTGAIRTNPIVYVSALVKSCLKGDFEPAAGYTIAKAREARKEELRKRHIEEQQHVQQPKEYVRPPKEFFDNLKVMLA